MEAEPPYKYLLRCRSCLLAHRVDLLRSYARSASATNASKTGAVKTTSSPRDPQSGLPTGQRIHKPFIIKRQ
jgi:hypothetical protein